MIRESIVIVTNSSCPYVPLNVKCNALIKNKKLISVHRVENGAGTYLNGNECIDFIEIK
jgi:hypothetical protein